MKIAVSSTGRDLKNKVSEVFARCPFFIIVEVEDGKVKEFEAIKNENQNQMGGAGISVAQLMAEKNVKAVVTKNVGPRAFDVLKQFEIDVFVGEGPIEKILQEFIEGKLKKMD